MKAQGDFTPMNPGESEVFAFDFTMDLPTGDSIISVVWSLTVQTGSDPNSQSYVGATSLVGNLASVRITGPLARIIYILTATATTTQGNTLDLWAFLPCLPLGAPPSQSLR